MSQASQSCASKQKQAQPAATMIAIASGKGGVGKSTVTHNLATTLAQLGKRVGIIDADIYGPSQTGLFAAQGQQCSISEDGWIIPIEQEGVAFVSIASLMEDDGAIIWRAPMATRLITDFLTRVKWPELDYLLIDLPPGTGDIQITLSQQAELSGALIVTTPQKVAYQVAAKAIEMFAKVHVPILGIVENMSGFVCPHCHQQSQLFKQEGGQILAEQHNTTVVAQIPLHESVMSLAEAGQSVIHAEHDNPARQQYQQLAENLASLIATNSDVNAPESYEISDSKGLNLRWPDDGEHEFAAYALRLNCPCAHCVDETSGQPLLDKSSVALDISVTAVALVGRYGLRITFSDGHNTGIYTFDVLRAMFAVEQNNAATCFEV